MLYNGFTSVSSLSKRYNWHLHSTNDINSSSIRTTDSSQLIGNGLTSTYCRERHTRRRTKNHFRSLQHEHKSVKGKITENRIIELNDSSLLHDVSLGFLSIPLSMSVRCGIQNILVFVQCTSEWFDRACILSSSLEHLCFLCAKFIVCHYKPALNRLCDRTIQRYCVKTCSQYVIDHSSASNKTNPLLTFRVKTWKPSTQV